MCVQLFDPVGERFKLGLLHYVSLLQFCKAIRDLCQRIRLLLKHLIGAQASGFQGINFMNELLLVLLS